MTPPPPPAEPAQLPEMRRTSIRGHALRSEGDPTWIPVISWGGHALCECGATSRSLDSNRQRQKWHAAHKQAIRAATDGATVDVVDYGDGPCGAEDHQGGVFRCTREAGHGGYHADARKVITWPPAVVAGGGGAEGGDQ